MRWQASTIRDSLKTAKEQAAGMQGAELTISDQRDIIAVLERELKKRGSVQDEAT